MRIRELTVVPNTLKSPCKVRKETPTRLASHCREFFLGQVTIDENLHYLDTMIGAIAWDRKIVRVVRRKRLTRCAEQELTQLRSSLVAAIGPHQFGYQASQDR